MALLRLTVNPIETLIIMDSNWAVCLKDNDNNRGQKYPFYERTAFYPDSINLFITICDYDEEKYDDDEKILDRIFNAVGPGLRGGRFWKRVVVLLIIRFSCCLVFLKWDSDEGSQSLSFVVKF